MLGVNKGMDMDIGKALLVANSNKRIYAYYNANPANKETNDCVIRSLCTAYNKQWLDVSNELYAIAIEQYTVLSSKEVYEAYLSKNNATYIKTMEKTKRVTAGEFALKHKQGTYILRLAHHLTVCVSGVILDTWDCTDKMCYCAWEI